MVCYIFVYRKEIIIFVNESSLFFLAKIKTIVPIGVKQQYFIPVRLSN